MEDILTAAQNAIAQIGVEPLLGISICFSLIAILLALVGIRRGGGSSDSADLNRPGKTLKEFNGRFSDFVSESTSASEEIKSKLAEVHERLQALEGVKKKSS